MSEFAEEYDRQPYGSVMREMITSAIPYLFRWKILQIKQLLYDLTVLKEKYGIAAAQYAIDAVKEEAESLCSHIASLIISKREQIKKYMEMR